MESEKIKEIKKALEDNANYKHHDKLGYIDDYKCKTVSFADILTLINELESENERLKEEEGSLSCDLDYVNKELTKAEIEIDDYKDRIAELEKENTEQLKKFAEKVLKFVKEYAFKDRKEIYTNGTILVPLFRVEYALETGGQDYQQG